MIVALARKLLIALWRLVREGVVPDGVVMRLPTQSWRPVGARRLSDSYQTPTMLKGRRATWRYADRGHRDEPVHAMVRLLARVVGDGIETADMLVHEVLSRNMRDRRAVARYAGLTGSPDESGRKRREKGLARSGNARVRRGMIQLAWRFLLHNERRTLKASR